MSSNNYQIYVNQTLQLASTIVIKSSYTAEAINEGIIGISGYSTSVDPDPSTWKYYLNLAGQYHSTDRLMSVVSMDTLETIEFTQANLQIHTATSRAYQYGTRQYTELVAAYPDQEMLILGILYPVDLQTAIDANDGKILAYPPNLVEANEYSLIDRLQQWIYQFKQRWYIPAFDLTDELYHATHLATMYSLLLQAIFTYRIKACNTNEAHSYHVRQYLGSHGYLDAYVDSLTTKQALYFYQNIAYIERNVGKRDTFDTLLNHIMSERSIPLAEYTMKHDVSTQPESLYSGVFFRKKQLNLDITLDPNNETSLSQLLYKQVALAPGNGDEVDDQVLAVKEIMENSSSNVVATKSLESSMIDETNSTPYRLEDVLFNQWIDLSSRGMYNAYVNITNPVTGEHLPLTAKESFVLAMYAYAKSVDKTLDVIPYAYASHVQRLPEVSTFSRMALTSESMVDDIYSIVDQNIVPRQVAADAVAYQPTIAELISTDAFYSVCVDINDAIQAQRFITAYQENYQRRAMVQAMVGRLYSDNIIALAPEGTQYTSWLSDRSINLEDFKRSDFELLYTEIVSQATGIALHPTQSLKQLQEQMVKMFTQLSSYGIQVIAEINDSTIRKTDWKQVSIGKMGGQLNSHLYFPDVATEMTKASTIVQPKLAVDVTTIAIPELYTEVRYGLKASTRLDTSHDGTGMTIVMRGNIPKVKTWGEVPDNIPRGWVPFIGIENILALTPDQLMQIKDIYSDGINTSAPDLIQLAQVVVITELLAFDLGLRPDPLTRSILNTLLGRTYPQ